MPAEQQGTSKPAGEFVHGAVLTPARLAPIEKAVLAAPPARTCSGPAGRFALLRAADGSSGEVYVELDRCLRLMAVPVTGGPVLAQGSAELAALLDRR